MPVSEESSRDTALWSPWQRETQPRTAGRGHRTAQPPVPCVPQDPGALLPWESALGAGRVLLPAQPPCLAPQVRIALQLDDGSRLQDTFCSGRTLWELLSHFPQTRRVSGVLAVPPAVVLVWALARDEELLFVSRAQPVLVSSNASFHLAPLARRRAALRAPREGPRVPVRQGRRGGRASRLTGV